MANNILLTPNTSAGTELSAYQQNGAVNQNDATEQEENKETQPDSGDNSAYGPIVIEDAPQAPPRQDGEKPLREWGLTFGSEEERQAYGKQLMSELSETLTRNNNTQARINTKRAITEGFGTSKYDAHYTPGMDVEDARAKAQSWGSKVGLGIVKLGTTAATTAANNTFGLAWGLATGVGSLMQGNGLRGAFDDAVNNTVSETLIRTQEWADKVFPNYTEEKERTDEYQRQWFKPSVFFSGNFLGNNVLKNFGFTVGSIGSGALIGKGVNRIARNKFAKQISKATAKAIAGDAEVGKDLQRIAEGIRRGTISAADMDALSKAFPQIARLTRQLGPKTALEMAVFSAVGEGTSEGIMAANEFIQSQEGLLAAKFKENYDSLEAILLDEGDRRFVNKRAFEDEYGNITTHKILTEDGKLELQRRQQEAVTNYNLEKRKMYNEAERLSSTTMLLNLPVLTASNVIGWGKVLAGGEASALRTRKNKSKISGKISIGEKGALTSTHKPRYNKFVNVLKESGKTAASEAFEEMAQGTLSSGTKTVAERRLKSFEDSDIAGYTNAGYDADTLDSVALWLEDMSYGGKNYLGDIKNWQEGAIGALTGLFGIPGRRWKGGVIGAIQDAKDESNMLNKAAAALDEVVNSEDFQTRWHNWIRGLKYRSEQEVALEKGDMYAWHNADDKALINDIITFAEADSLDELRDFVTRFSEVSDSDVLEIKSLASSSTEEVDEWLKNAPAEQIKQKVSDRAKDLGKVIDTYFAIYDDLSTIAPQGTDKNFFNEIVFTSMQLKAFENRYLTLLNEVLTDVEPLLQRFAEDTKEDVVDKETGVVKYDTEQRLQKYRNLIDQYFSGSLLPRDSEFFQGIMAATETLLDDIVLFDSGIKVKVEDMKKLSESRRQFFKKLITLKSDEGQQKHHESSITQEEVKQEVEQQELKNELESYNTVEDFIGEYMKRNHKGKLQFLDMLDQDENPTDASKEANKMLKMYNYIRKALLNKFSNIGFGTSIPVATIASDIWDMIVKAAKSSQDLHNLPDSIIPTVSAVASATTLSIFNEELYNKALKALRQIVTEINKRQDATGKLVEELDFGTLVSIYNSINPSNTITIATEEQEQEEEYRRRIEDEAKKRDEARRKKAADDEQKKIDENEKQFMKNHTMSEEDGYDPPAPIITHTPTEDEVQRIKNEVKKEKKKAKPKSKAKSEPTGPTVEDYDIASEDVDNESFSGMKSETAEADEIHMQDPQNISEDSSVFSEEVGECRPSYQTSVPEISAMEMIKWRRDGKGDLSDFPKTKEGAPYKKVWDALDERGAFDYVDQKLKVGDKLYFVVDPSFPTYNREPQILVCVKKKDGTYQALNVLTRRGEAARKNKISKVAYYGVDELRENILTQAKSYHSRNPKSLFVYDKTSVVRARRGGVIVPSKARGGSNVNIPMTKVEGVDVTGELDFALADKNGNILPIAGSERALGGLGKIKRKNANGLGLYLTTHNISGDPVPLRVNIRKFNKETAYSKNALATSARDALHDVEDLIKGINLDITDAESARELIAATDDNAAGRAYYNYTKKRDGKGTRLVDKAGKPLEAYEYIGVFEQEDADGKELLDFARYVQVENLNAQMHDSLREVANRIAITDYFFNVAIDRRTNKPALTITKRKYGLDKITTFEERLKAKQEKEKAKRDGVAVKETTEAAPEDESAETEKTAEKKDENLGESIVFPIASFAQNDLVDYFAGEKVPYHFALNKTALQQAAQEGILEMNVESIYPKGVDFMYDPYIPSEGRFAPLSQTLVDHSKENSPAKVEEIHLTETESRATGLNDQILKRKEKEAEEAKKKAEAEAAEVMQQPAKIEVKDKPAEPVPGGTVEAKAEIERTLKSAPVAEPAVAPVEKAPEVVAPLVTSENDKYAAMRNSKGCILPYRELHNMFTDEQLFDTFKDDLDYRGIISLEEFLDAITRRTIDSYLECI